MWCFRVDEDVFRGIYLREDADGHLCVDVGHESVKLEPGFSNSLISAKNEVISTLKDAMSNLSTEDGDLSVEEFEKVLRAKELASSDSIQLLYADIIDGTIVKEQERSLDALVLVETSAGERGKIFFKGAVYEEHVDGDTQRVKRRYRGEFPPPGVTVVKEGKTRQGGRCFLLRMIPNSSIRIERTGKLRGEPSVLTLVWKGVGQGRPKQSPLLLLSNRKNRAA